MPSTLSTYSNNKVGLRLELAASEDQNECVEPGVPTALSKTDNVLFPFAKLSWAKPVISQDNFASTRTVGNFLTKSTAIIATLFIISSISLVVLSRGDLEEKKSVIERLEQEKDSDLPKIPDSQK